MVCLLLSVMRQKAPSLSAMGYVHNIGFIAAIFCKPETWLWHPVRLLLLFCFCFLISLSNLPSWKKTFGSDFTYNLLISLWGNSCFCYVWICWMCLCLIDSLSVNLRTSGPEWEQQCIMHFCYFILCKVWTLTTTILLVPTTFTISVGYQCCLLFHVTLTFSNNLICC